MPLTRYDSALLNSRPHTMPTMLYTFIPEWHLPEPMSELTGVRNHSSFPLSAGYPQIRSPASRRLYHNFIPLSTCTIKDLSLSSGTTVSVQTWSKGALDSQHPSGFRELLSSQWRWLCCGQQYSTDCPPIREREAFQGLLRIVRSVEVFGLTL